MDRYGVMGNPVAHSRSPWIHHRFAQLTGQDLRYERLLVPLDGFARAVQDWREQGGLGCNVTVPFKFEAAALAGAQLTERAQLAGACNTLCFEAEGGLRADNTDGIGLVRDITLQAGVVLAGRRVLLVGAGGAGAGVLGPLLQAQPASLTLTNRSPAKADALAARHAPVARRHGVLLRACGIDALDRGYDIVINATASSLGGADSPVPASVLREGALACDLMYGPSAQPFLDWAARHGAVPRDGLGMLVEQAAESFALWRGVRPPAGQVLRELRAALAAGTA